jgi:hypothetical protein
MEDIRRRIYTGDKYNRIHLKDMDYGNDILKITTH